MREEGLNSERVCLGLRKRPLDGNSKRSHKARESRAKGPHTPHISNRNGTNGYGF